MTRHYRFVKSAVKTVLPFLLATILAVGLSTAIALSPALAATFGQKEVDQNKFIAVAVPRNNMYQLTIVEQLSPARDCWSESGTQPPVRVEPLLLNFDFTGICARNTDSNGYSIRVDGEDLGQQYGLRLARRSNELVLIGSAYTGNAPEIKIGRTYGIINDGFTKVVLEPGWRFTKRTYNGKILGHVYLTKGQSTEPLFQDIANDIYAKEIEAAAKIGFVSGFEDNTFRPENSLTREQLVSMVLEALRKLPGVNLTIPTQVSSRPYPDVEVSRWSAAKIQFAREKNIVSGYDDGTFRPTQMVTRAELIAVQRRAAEYGKSLRGLDSELDTKQQPTIFSDMTNHWAAALASQMSGYCAVASPLNEAGTRFYPDTAAKRNYAAAATLRMLKCVESE